MTTDRNEVNDGHIFLIDKPIDYSSARIVNIIKKKLNIKKAGHSGTLDPKATGLMIVCTNKKTKLLAEMLGYDKEYEGVMILGETTPSFDTETDVVKKRSLENIDKDLVIKMAEEFTGEIEQIPPMYSAIKYKGKPLYKYARRNKEIERRPRKIMIKEFEIKKIEFPMVEFKIICSKGTYIRSLVNDFGEKLGAGAYLKELRRTKIGSFDINDSMTIDKFINEF